MANTQTFTGDGTTTAFYFTFPFFGINDIKVSIDAIPQTSDDFSVHPTQSPAPADTPYTGGRIDFATAPSNGAIIKVWRDIELTRHIDYQPTAQPQSHQLNQDINQCIEILKELAATLTNILSLSSIPTLSSLLDDLTTIQNTIGTLATASSVTILSGTVDDHTTSISNLNDTVGGHTTSIATLNNYDYVTSYQAPTADNNYTWYRKYKSGWIEMGGYDSTSRSTSSNTTASATIAFPTEFSDTNYTFVATTMGGYCFIQEKNNPIRSTTGINVEICAGYPNSNYTSNGFAWLACGF